MKLIFALVVVLSACGDNVGGADAAVDAELAGPWFPPQNQFAVPDLVGTHSTVIPVLGKISVAWPQEPAIVTVWTIGDFGPCAKIWGVADGTAPHFCRSDVCQTGFASCGFALPRFDAGPIELSLLLEPGFNAAPAMTITQAWILITRVDLTPH